MPKTIGRHKGFIIEVTHSSEETKVRYYAKIQTVHIHTVMIHYLLKYTKCGPDDFHIVLLTSQDTDDPLKLYKLGVVTKEVENCKMALAWTEDEAQRICYSEQLFRTDTFLATLIFAFGRFGNMPRNRDNWGFTNWEKKGRNVASATRPCLMIVDFSSGGVEAATSSYILFLGSWAIHSVLMCQLLVGINDNQSIVSYVTKLLDKDSIWSEAHNFEWLHSKHTLLNLLQRVCNATDQWICDIIRKVCPDSVGVDSYDSTPSAADTENAAYPLQSFKHVVKPAATCYENNPQLLFVLEEYEQQIAYWNYQLVCLFKWFPFPCSLSNEIVNMVPSPPLAPTMPPIPAPAPAPAPVSPTVAATMLPTRRKTRKPCVIS